MSDRSMRTEEMAIDLGALWRAFWRARFWLVPLLALVAVGSYFALSTLPPKYRAEAKVLIEARGSRIDAGQKDAEAERTLLDPEGVTSQVQLISSRDLARRVVQREKLDSVAEFRKGPGLLGTLLPFLKRGGAVSPEQQVLDAYFERLTVYAIEKSRVIAVEFVAGDPEVAARVANALVREYLAVQGEAKVSTSTDASVWLESEITGLRAKVADAEAKVEQWRASHDLFSTNRDGSLVEQQLSGLNTQLTAARTEKAAIEARAEQLRRVIAGGALDASADLQTSASYQRLRERETLLRSRLAELSATLLSGHPQIRALSAQISDIQTQQRAEARRVLAALDNEVKVADQKLRDLRGVVGDGKATAAKANENDIQLRALEREAKAQRDLLETFLARYREAISRQNDRALPPDARAISEASPPTAAYFPKVLPLTFLITVAVFLIATAFIILRELVSGRAVRPAAWQPATAVASTPVVAPSPVAAASDPVEAAPASAPANVAANDPTDPDDPDGSGGRRPETRRDAAKPDQTPALVAAARDAHGAAGIAARHHPDLTDPDEIAWSHDEVAAATVAVAPTAAPEPVDEPVTEPVTVVVPEDLAPEALDVAFNEDGEGETPIAVAADAPEVPVSPPRARAAGLPALGDVLTQVFQAGCALVAVVTPATGERSRATALVTARRAATIGRACLVEWAAHETPLGDRPGLADLIAGTAGFDDIIGGDSASGLHLIPAGTGGIPSATLDDPAFGLALDALASCYDRLIVDGGVCGAIVHGEMPELLERLHGMDTVIIAIGADEVLAGERLRLALAAAGLGDVVMAEAAAPDEPTADRAAA